MEIFQRRTTNAARYHVFREVPLPHWIRDEGPYLIECGHFSSYAWPIRHLTLTHRCLEEQQCDIQEK
jgi:hypothetical protein